jgi:tetratricopeptide (TPR) repeat protein
MMTEGTQEKIIAAYQIASRGDFDHARMILEEALYDSSENIEAWLLLADLAENQDEARQCYQMVLEISPDNWIAQQRLKILFSQDQVVEQAVEQSFTPVEEEEEFPDFEDFSPEEELEETGDSPSVKETLLEAFNTHREFFIKLGAGVAGLLLLMIIGWVASIGFIAWRMGYLIIGG